MVSAERLAMGEVLVEYSAMREAGRLSWRAGLVLD